MYKIIKFRDHGNLIREGTSTDSNSQASVKILNNTGFVQYGILYICQIGWNTELGSTCVEFPLEDLTLHHCQRDKYPSKFQRHFKTAERRHM